MPEMKLKGTHGNDAHTLGFTKPRIRVKTADVLLVLMIKIDEAQL